MSLTNGYLITCYNVFGTLSIWEWSSSEFRQCLSLMIRIFVDYHFQNFDNCCSQVQVSHIFIALF